MGSFSRSTARPFVVLATTIAGILLVGCARLPGLPPTSGSPTGTSSATATTSPTVDITGVINFDGWRTAEGDCLEYASAEGLVDGSSVELLGSDGSTLGRDTLSATYPDDRQACMLDFAFGDVPSSDSYGFVVAGRPTKTFGFFDLASAGWHVDLSPDAGVYDEAVEDTAGAVRLSLTAPIVLEAEGTATCSISSDSRFPDRGLTTIAIQATSLASVAGHDVSTTATLKLIPNWLTYATVDVLLDGEPAYHAAPDMMTGSALANDMRGGEVSVGSVPFTGTGASLDATGGGLAGTLEWSCGEGVDADKAVGQVSIGAPFDVEVDITAGRCDPPSPEGWQPMWLPFTGETAYGPMTGEINRMFATLLDLQLDIPNLGEQRLLITEFEWDGQPSQESAQGTTFEVATTVDFGLIDDVAVNDVPFAATWICPS